MARSSDIVSRPQMTMKYEITSRVQAQRVVITLGIYWVLNKVWSTINLLGNTVIIWLPAATFAFHLQVPNLVTKNLYQICFCIFMDTGSIGYSDTGYSDTFWPFPGVSLY